jgi:hypothetical protein
MDAARIREICRQRLQQWEGRLVEEHATPALLIGVGHDHKSGQLVLLVPEEVTNEQILELVRFAHERCSEFS